MSVFQFSLQKVLNLRGQKERAKAVDLAHASNEEARAREQREEAERLREEASRQMSTLHAKGTLNAGMLNVLAETVRSAETEAAHREENHKNAQQSLDLARINYQEARREKDVLEKLRERRLDVFKQGERLKDQMSTDEAARTQFLTKDASQQPKTPTKEPTK